LNIPWLDVWMRGSASLQQENFAVALEPLVLTVVAVALASVQIAGHKIKGSAKSATSFSAVIQKSNSLRVLTLVVDAVASLVAAISFLILRRVSFLILTMVSLNEEVGTQRSCII